MKHRSIQAVVFDMDGLLLDSEVYWERARRDYCGALGCVWRREDELSVKGHNSPEWASVIRGRCSSAPPVAQIISGVTDQMEALYREHLPLLPGAVETVRSLAPLYPMAVASSSPLALIEFALRKAGIRHCFGDLVSADDVGRGKPNPDVFLAAAERLHTVPRSVAVFEDSTAGIMAGRNAEMFVIAVPNPHYPPSEVALKQANLVLASLTDFRPDLLRDA